MFLLVSVRHVGAHPDGHQHGVSIQISINLGKTFFRISRIRNILLTWILAGVFVYLPSFISQIPDFIYWTVFIIIIIIIIIIIFDQFCMAWHWKPSLRSKAFLCGLGAKNEEQESLVSFLARPVPRIPFLDLGLSLLPNQTETLATQATENLQSFSSRRSCHRCSRRG